MSLPHSEIFSFTQPSLIRSFLPSQQYIKDGWPTMMLKKNQHKKTKNNDKKENKKYNTNSRFKDGIIINKINKKFF